MVAITNTTSLTFLKESIDATLSEAEASLEAFAEERDEETSLCLLYTSPSPRDRQKSRMPSSA